jgi:hypothetical protein
MTYGTFTNTYLVGRKIVPFVTAPAEQNHSDRRRTGDPVRRRGLMALMAHLAHFYLARHPRKPTPQPSPKPASETSPRLRPASPRRLETSHPPRQDAQINYLDILTIFMKQRTYLAILPFIWSPCPIAPRHQRNSRRNVTSSVRRPFAQVT